MLKPYTERLVAYAPVLLRLIVGITFLMHGLQKLQDPASFIGLMAFLKMPLLPVSGWFIILLETVGGLFMLLGLGTRWLGILFAIEMAVSTLLAKLSIGFIASPGAPTAGYELDLLLLVTSLSLVLLGSGPFSVEQNVLKWAGAQKSSNLST
jgi:putative oxidoreductase